MRAAVNGENNFLKAAVEFGQNFFVDLRNDFGIVLECAAVSLCAKSFCRAQNTLEGIVVNRLLRAAVNGENNFLEVAVEFGQNFFVDLRDDFRIVLECAAVSHLLKIFLKVS